MTPQDLSHALLIAVLMDNGGSMELPAGAFEADALGGVDGSWHAVEMTPDPAVGPAPLGRARRRGGDHRMSGHLAVPLTLPPGPGPVDVQAHAFTVLTDAALSGDEWDADALGTVLDWGGKLAGPHLLSDAWDGGLIDAAAVAAHIGQVWSAAEYPDAALGHDRWRELFDVAGFTVDGAPAGRPGGPVELWRGSVPERRADWSWSTDWETAGRYASGYFGRPRGRLYRLIAPPGALLCANGGREEAEFVVDTAHPGVVITDG